ncbi:MAG: MMPL family transporter [Deltaproteobacteria bacterium]|nr:MMPL family transporter [Deltaproteobacteria bacterium]
MLLTGWFAWQLPSIRTDSDARSYLGKDDPVGQALDRMEDIFGEQDLFMTTAICLPVLVAIGFLVFRSPVMALLLVAPEAFAVLLTYGALGIAGIPADFGIAVLSGITLGIGVDFSVHYLHRYRELRNHGMEHEGASVLTAATAGRVLFFNAVVLVGGFLVLLGARFYPQVKLGLLVTTTMVICYVYTLYLFPAGLGLFAADKSSTVEGPS